LGDFTGIKPSNDAWDEMEDEDNKEHPEEDREFRPSEPLSELTEQLVQKMFPPEEQIEVRQLLINKCGNNIYAHEDRDKYGLEPLRFSALKLSKGNLKKLQHHVQKGNEDYRNLLYGSGFSGPKGEDKQKKWVQSVLDRN